MSTSDDLGAWIDERVEATAAPLRDQLADAEAQLGAAQTQHSADLTQIADLAEQVADDAVDISDLQARIVELEAQIPPPPPARVLIGAYNGVSVAGDDAWEAGVGARPQMATSYLNMSNTGPTALDLTSRPGKGILPLINWASKGLPNGAFALWRDIAAGVHDARFQTIAANIGTLHCRLAFDQEFEVRLNQNLVPAGQTPAEYAAAFRRVMGIIKSRCPNVETVYWVGGADHDKIAAGWPGADVVDWISYDPYKWAGHPVDETAMQVFAPFATWVRAQPWAAGKPLFISETGIDTGAFSEDVCATYWSQVVDAARALNLDAVVSFHSLQWKYATTPKLPKVCAAVAAAVAG